jgi:DNA-binding XRE family transcriptional regulator
MTTRHSRRPVKGSKQGKIAPAQANEVRSLRKKYALSQALLARLLDVSLRTVSELESSAVTSGRRNLTQVIRLCEALAEAMQPRYVSQWLDQPNEMLNNLKPIEAIERGHLDLVWQVAEGLRSGSQL